MKILIIDPLSDNTIYNLGKVDNVEIIYIPDITEEKILKQLFDISILIMRSSHIFTDEWLKKAVRLTTVIVAGNGTENIPVSLLQNNGIILKNVKNASVTSVAEYTVCLMLMSLRNIMQGLKSINNGKWEKNHLIGNEIKNKTVGLIGFGNIGKAIAELLDKFNVKIIYNNNTGPIDYLGFEHVELIELAKKSDVISIQVPLNEETRFFIDDNFFQAMKSSCTLINMSRYEVLNMTDLLKGLKDDKLKHVFIDPIEERYLDELSKFKNFPISFLPHLGANTVEAQDQIGVEIIKMIENIKLVNNVSNHSFSK